MDIPPPDAFIKALRRVHGLHTLAVVERWGADAYRKGNKDEADFWWRVADMIGPEVCPPLHLGSVKEHKVG